MKFVTSRDVKKNPAILWQNERVVLTVNGKPRAVVVNVSGDLEETLKAIDRAKAQLALERLRMESLEKGLDGLSESDGDNIIKEIRKGK